MQGHPQTRNEVADPAKARDRQSERPSTQASRLGGLETAALAQAKQAKSSAPSE